jgi:hypothetical protein
VAAVVVLVITACSGGGAAAARSKARAANVRATDLPAGWTSSPRPDPVGDEGDASRFAECLGRPDPKQVRSATAASPNFVLQDRSQVHTSAQVMHSAKTASADIAVLAGDRAVGCLRQRLSTDLQRDPASANKVLTMSVARRPGPGGGGQAAAFGATVSEKGAKVTTNRFVDVVLVAKGDVEIWSTFANRTDPFPADLEQTLLSRIVGRV